MKNKKPNAEQAWKDFEDLLVPRLRLSVIERATYSLLCRHTRLEGRRRYCFSISWLARALRLNATTARRALRSLAGKGALRIAARTYRGHVVELFLPHEIRAARRLHRPGPEIDLETLDFTAKKDLRNAIHRREGRRCFYCLRDVPRPQLCLDHVVPQVSHGPGSYRNLVSCCLNCNVRKSGIPAADYLRRLYRMRRLTASELAERLRALDALASGKLPPPLPAPGKVRTTRAHNSHGKLSSGMISEEW
jgi:5-methylcytosine-specific restriction endonuclease McrA